MQKKRTRSKWQFDETSIRFGYFSFFFLPWKRWVWKMCSQTELDRLMIANSIRFFFVRRTREQNLMDAHRTAAHAPWLIWLRFIDAKTFAKSWNSITRHHPVNENKVVCPRPHNNRKCAIDNSTARKKICSNGKSVQLGCVDGIIHTNLISSDLLRLNHCREWKPNPDWKQDKCIVNRWCSFHARIQFSNYNK